MKNRMFCKAIQRFQETVENAIGAKIAYTATLALFALSGLVSAQSGPALVSPASARPNEASPTGSGRDPGRKLERLRSDRLRLYCG